MGRRRDCRREEIILFFLQEKQKERKTNFHFSTFFFFLRCMFDFIFGDFKREKREQTYQTQASTVPTTLASNKLVLFPPFGSASTTTGVLY